MKRRHRAGAGRELVLICGVGTQNSGNDASYRIVLDLLRQVRGPEPTVLVTPFTDGAEEIAAETGARLVRLRQDLSEARRRPNRAAVALGVIGGETAQLRQLIATVRRASLVVVTGTGVFDDFGERPWHMPYALLSWVGAARLARVPFVCLAVGAGPIANPLSRRLMAFAARGMSRVTYRDADSLTYMEGIGAGRPEATVCPDVVFAHPPPDAAEPAPTAGRVTVGVGVMAYGGWSNPGEGDVYQRYLAMLTEVVTGIVQAGDAVRLLVGQPIDLPTAQLLLSGLSPEIAAQVEPAEFREMPGLLETVGQCDLVVATRYHNVVAALLMRRPVVSLSYAPKNAVLLRDVGMSEFDRRVEDADAGWVLARVRGLRSGKARLPADADARLTDWGSRVRAEVARVSETYPSPST